MTKLDLTCTRSDLRPAMSAVVAPLHIYFRRRMTRKLLHTRLAAVAVSLPNTDTTKISHSTDGQDQTHRDRHASLVHISEIRVLLVGQVLESVDVALVVGLGHTGGCSGIALLVEACQVEAEEDDDEQQEHVAAHVGAEGDEVARFVGVAEHLRACLVQC